ncbi:MAG: hypothetical protein KDG55_17790 [Rhodocyclaceae bacterium]|nr:hypothetical protein [Rhodocyclaceae bacterium]
MSKQDTEFFSSTANCYGYAAKCAAPGGSGTACPAGEKPGSDAADYARRLRDGVLADGGAKVKLLLETTAQTVTAGTIPTPRADWYLIALLVKAEGFHFVRRQLSHFGGEPFWKWKQGNGGVVERNAYDGGAKKWIRVTNAEFPRLVRGDLMTDMPGYRGWNQLYFFEVAKSGFDVTRYT